MKEKIKNFKKNKKDIVDLELKERKERIINLFLIIIIIVLLILLIILINIKKYSGNNNMIASSMNDSKDNNFVFEYDGEKNSIPPQKSSNYVSDIISCNNASGYWDNNLWDLRLSNISGNVSCYLSFKKDNNNNVIAAVENKGKKASNSLLKKDIVNKANEDIIVTNDDLIIETNNNGEIEVKKEADELIQYSSNTNIKTITSSFKDISYSNDINDYYIEVNDGVDKISFDIVLEDNNAKVIMDDIYKLKYGKNNIKIIIIAEDNTTSKELNIVVNRIKETKDIIIAEDSITIDKNNQKKIDYKLEPKDTSYKEVLFKSRDENIAKVDKNGVITGINYGSTIIDVSSNNINKEVIVNIKNITIKNNNYNINRNSIEDYIIGFEPKTKINDILSTFDNDTSNLLFYNKNNDKIEDYNSNITTGMTIKLVIDNNLYDIIKVVVRGDINKDGFINVNDYKKLNKYLNNTIDFDFIEKKAADVIEDDNIDQYDYEKINDFITKIITTVN